MHVQASPTTKRFRACVLGPFALELDGTLVDTSRWQRRVEVLFKLLLTSPDRQRRRDDLVDILWPDADPENGIGNLRMLVHRLRTTLDLGDPSPVLSDGGWIALNPDCEWALDLDVLESVAADLAAPVDVLAQTAALYRGEPLPEDRYEDWAQPIRERATHAWRALCLRLGREHMTSGATDKAIRWLERALEEDPFDEEALRQLLTALHRSGRTAEAVRRYATFERLLRDEVDAPPSPETRALVERIRSDPEGVFGDQAGRLVSVTPPANLLGPITDIPLVGRAQELEIALAAVHAAAAGTGRLLLLSGEVGVGKTRLAQEIINGLAETGFLVTVGRCSLRRRAILWAPFVDALEPLLATAPAPIRASIGMEWPALAALLGNGAVGPQGEEVNQRQLFSAVRGFLRALAQEQPVAIVLEDLHQADDATVDLLHALARELRSSRIFVLGTYCDADISREHPVAIALREMAREGLIDRIALSRLGFDETAAMVRQALGDAPGTEAFAEYVHRRTRGLPFFIDRLLHVLGGQYRLLRPVGAGGMGWVFEAEDTATGNRVAVKIVFARREAEPRMLLRFQQEAAALARLDHPGIVKIHEAAVDEYGGRIVMELLSGQALSATVPPEGLTLEVVKRVVRQIAAALSYAHEHGVLHRDLKPDNIMVDEMGHATLTDFGIARVLWPESGTATLTMTAVAAGTSLYMAPEQLERSREDARSDIYSLGVVLYQLVTGHPPFLGDDAISVAIKHVHHMPAPPSVVRPGLPPDWDALILRCLAKAPSERFQSAAALEKAIAALPAAELPAAGARPPFPPIPVPIPGAVAPAGFPDGETPSPTRRIPPRVTRWWPMAAAVVVLLAGTTVYLLERPAAPKRAGANTHGVTHQPVQTSQGGGPGQFRGPSGIGVDPIGHVWVADSGNDRVQEISPDGIPLASFGSHGVRTGQFDTPQDIAVTSQGRIYVDDKNNNRVPKYDASGRQADELDSAYGSVAVGPSDHLYVGELVQGRVFEFTWNLDPIADWSIRSVRVQRRPYPAGFAVDRQGRLYVADRGNNRVLVLVPRGRFLVPIQILGTDPHQYVFNDPSDVALDGAGNIYVADTRNNRIVELSPQGKLKAFWGHAGTGLGQFDQPTSLAVDAQGNVYVTDFFNDRVQKFAPGGMALWATAGLRPIHA